MSEIIYLKIKCIEIGYNYFYKNKMYQNEHNYSYKDKEYVNLYKTSKTTQSNTKKY